MNRRDFLRTGASGAAASFAATQTFRPHAAWAASSVPKRVGLIGTGWYGKCDLLRLIQVAPVDVVSLCDVDQKMLTEAGEIVASRHTSGKTPRLYGDYRKMLAEKDLDIVLIASPDHWHPLQMISAVEAGADVYVQKPISVDQAEGLAMLKAAREHNRVVQVGTQRRSTPHLIEARDRIVREGLLGKIAHSEIYCYYHMRARGIHPPIDVPEGFDYEMWTGPAPMQPFNDLIHPRRWRSFMEYGNGIIGDMCIHMLDTVRWMLDLGAPRRVSSSGGILVDKESTANISDTQTAMFDFDELPVVWQHRTWGTTPDPDYPWGATLYGDKGTLRMSVQRWDFTPRGGGQPLHGEVEYEYEQYPEDETEKDLERHVAPAIRGHMLDFLTAIENRGRPVADIEQGYISTTACVLANKSLELGRTLEWDAEKHKVVGDDEANRILKRDYRSPWTHPAD
jgi:predicted dehydrogenase